MRCVCRDVDGLADAHKGLLAAERGFHLAFQQDEGFFEIVAVRWRTAAWWDVHVDDAKAPRSLLTGDSDSVGVANKADVGQCLIGVRACARKSALQIVGWKRWVLRGGLGHASSPF